MLLFKIHNYEIKIGQIGCTDCSLIISRSGKEKELLVEDDNWLKINSALTQVCKEIDAILDKDSKEGKGIRKEV